MSNIVARLTNLIEVSENECEREFYTELRTEIERLHRQLVSDINAETEIDRLETEVERLRAALSFYGDYLSYGRGRIRYEGERPEVMKDNGKLARRVLEGK